MVNFLKILNEQQVKDLPGHGRVEQIAGSLQAILDVDDFSHMRSNDYDKYKGLLPHLVRIALAQKLK